MVDKNQVLTLMDESQMVYLATVGEAGPNIRALVNLRRQDAYPGPSRIARADGFTVYLATSGASGKVRDVRADPRVAVYYCDPNSYHGVTLKGRAEILTDPGLKRELWSEDWRIYWAGGAEDPDYVVLRVKTDAIEGWWGTAQFRLDAV
jgi:general stress protein 26